MAHNEKEFLNWLVIHQETGSRETQGEIIWKIWKYVCGNRLEGKLQWNWIHSSSNLQSLGIVIGKSSCHLSSLDLGPEGKCTWICYKAVKNLARVISLEVRSLTDKRCQVQWDWARDYRVVSHSYFELSYSEPKQIIKDPNDFTFW